MPEGQGQQTQEHTASTSTPTTAAPSESGPPGEQAPASQNVNVNDGDHSSSSESNSDSSTSTETPGTVSTPRSSAQDSGHPVPESGSTQLDGSNQPAQTPSMSETAQPTETQPNDAEHLIPSDNAEPVETPAIPPPSANINLLVPVTEHVPSWVQYEEDTSTPDEAELKEIEADKHALNATDTTAIEKEVFSDLEDPEYRPCKKIRLSWVVKGVRGTREKPNRARIMVSPSVYIDGHYWSMKFFPRGNKSRSSLSAYVRCSPIEAEPNKEALAGSFKAYACAPDADLSKCEPLLDVELKLPEAKEEEPTSSKEKSEGSAEPKPEHNAERDRQDDHDDDESISGDEDDDRPDTPVQPSTVDDYRVSAQLGLAVYNPAEPRTNYTSSASHQFYPHQDDWGWDTAVSHWEDIHRRKHGQRQALLRDDTLALDAYIRIYEDSTKALFWHSAPGESQWDSKGLAGVFPVGTRLLYHSPATAGIAAWSQLAPFRKAIQNIEAGDWRKDSTVRPKPLVAHLQLMLFQMRHMKKDELYVHLDSVIHEITRSGESFDNINAFWEAFRRSIEIETSDDTATREALAEAFGTPQQIRLIPKLPVWNVENFQQAANRAFTKAEYRSSLPSFLTLTLDRQSFDSEKRQWQVDHDRVRINENLDLSEYCTDEDGKYTLFGLIVHDGERTSGKFFSVLRPGGPGGKWLMFSDGNGNKVFSYTKKRVEEFEGLEGSELRRFTSTRQTIYAAMYVRTSCLSEYLPEQMEPFKLPLWLKPHLDEIYHHEPDYFEEAVEADQEAPVSIEVYWDKLVGGQEGKLDLYKLKTNERAREPEHRQVLTANRNATIDEVREKIASLLEVEGKAFKLWAMNYHRLGGVSKGYMYVLPDTSRVSTCLGTSEYLSLWMTIVPVSHDLSEEILAKNFMKINGVHVEAPPEPETVPEVKHEPPPPADGEAASTSDAPPVETNERNEATSSDDTEAAPDAEQNSVQEAVQQSVQGTTAETPAQTVEDTAAAEPQPEESPCGHEIAAQDAEQDSVREAVEQSTQSMPLDGPRATAEVTEIEPSDTTSAVRSSPTPESAPENNGADVAGSQPSPTPDTAVANTSSRNEGAPETIAMPTDTVTTGQTSTPQPVTPSEPMNAADMSIASTTNAVGDENVPPVVHGHLFEASAHAEPPLTHGEPPLPAGFPITIGNDQIIVIQPNQEDISVEDAALISSMIAADLEAAERARRRDRHADDEPEEGESDAEDEAIESRPSTPRQRIVDVYGFLHVFDAEAQKFTVHSTFMVPRDTLISTMVRKQMSYDEEKSFHLWKRDGTYRTVGVSLESTFQNCSLTDCCEVIVGEHLDEAKLGVLKAEAKYVDPGQLMRYLAMVQRGHPVSSLTNEEPVEINDFGNDYYKGPLVRGQRHGKECSLITQSGDTYEGPLVAGQKSGGKGKMTYQNGDVYNGEWQDDQKHGQGEFLEKRTGNKYVGGYENDKRWGKGVTYWEQADQQAALCQVCYFEEVNALFYRCGHVVACYACAKQCAADSNGCPVCRKPVEAVVKMYRS